MLELLTSEKFVARFLQFGFAAIIAGVLLGVFIGEVRADQRKGDEKHDAIEKRIAGLENVMGQFLMSQERMVYLTRRQCINTAKTQAERDACSKDRD